jgi:hypothetical protein
MFAPITRTYSATFSTESSLPELPPYVRNRLSFPSSVEQNLAFLRAWQAQFVRDDGQPVDSFDFDYHLMWDHYRDPAYLQIIHILHQDIQLLQQLGLNGYISCQTQRAFFPTGLPMAVVGWSTWDTTRTTDSIALDYFAAAFGPAGGQALAYLTELSELFDPVYLRGEKPVINAQAAIALARVAAVVDAFLPTIERNLHGDTACWARSWHYLRQHAQIVTALASALYERALGHSALARDRWEALKGHVWQLEDDIHPVLDVYLFARVCDRLFTTD